MKVYECPTWCVYRHADADEWKDEWGERVVWTRKHETYYGQIHGGDDVVLSYAPEHVGVRVQVLDFDNGRTNEAVNMYAELRHLDAPGERAWVYVSIDCGGGLDLAPGSQAEAFASDLTAAAARFRSYVENASQEISQEAL